MPSETTSLSPLQEALFQQWLAKSGVKDLNTGSYDYRGYFKANGPTPYTWLVDHLPDTWKQHGHPKFSQESQYSKGSSDGGMWIGDNDTLLEQPPMAVSHQQAPGTLLRQLLEKQGIVPSR